MRMTLALTAALLAAATAAAEPDILIADFEGKDYGRWRTEGTAFGDGPARGTLPGQMRVSGYRGDGLVNSFKGGDRSTGTLTSPPITIERDFVNFLIGGGKHPGKTCIDLLVGGEVVRTATGPNGRPGGSEALDWASWDVRPFRGKRAVLRVVDRRAGGWGHVNIDHIVQSDRRAATTPAERTRDIKLTGKYLLFPVANAARPCRMQVAVGGKLIHNFDINLAAGKPDWWARIDASDHAGRTATVSVDRLRFGSKGLAGVKPAGRVIHNQPLYNERLRPQLRFSQMRGWNNDPNGMVYYDGEYHLFWQSNPFGPRWANMYWGHAVSKDLVHWEELPYALTPRTMAADKCFSGSAHVDVNNTGGWKTGDEDVMVAAFTDTGAGEAIAVSRDRGRSWTYIDENPVIRHKGRDPKLIWYQPAGHWVIAVYSERGGKRGVAFYKSKDLKTWAFTSFINGFFECPELFELPVDGDAEKKKWVLFAADAQYVIGSFDGKAFAPEHRGKHRVHYGRYYASQCFSRVPGGRVIQIGWAKIATPGMPFNQAFSLPAELTLKSTPAGPRMFAAPIKELETLRGNVASAKPQAIESGKPIRHAVAGQLLDIVVDVEPADAETITLEFGDDRVTYHVKPARLDAMPLPVVDGKVRFRVIVDRPMYEVVGGGGAVYKTAARKNGGRPVREVRLTVQGGAAKVRQLSVYPLRSIWRE